MTTLEDLTCSSASVEALREGLQSYGVARILEFVSPEVIDSLRHEAMIATSEFANYLNPYGPCSRFSLTPLPDNLSVSRDLVNGKHLSPLPQQFQSSRAVIEGELLRKITETYLGSSSGFMEVVAFARDHIPDHQAVYGKLHFDRRHQLKFIIYLNNADEENGAFGCIPGSHRLGRELYYRAWRQTLRLRTDDPLEIERAAFAVSEDEPVYRLVPCIFENEPKIGPYEPKRDRLTISGAAGTLVAFDTHLLHYGGFVKQAGGERWTLKGHSFAEARSASRPPEEASGPIGPGHHHHHHHHHH